MLGERVSACNADIGPWSRREALVVIVVAFVAGALRLSLSPMGNNYDLKSFWIVSEALLSGENVYVYTSRFNYGPAWAIVLAIIRGFSLASGEDTLERFHFYVTALLCVTDLLLALKLRRKFGTGAMLFLLLNPVSMLITGYHSQFDNLAILIALHSWSALENSRTFRASVEAGVLMGISLSFKQLFLPFIPWVLFVRTISPFKNRLSFAAIALLVFFAGFGASGILDDEVAHAIRVNVFEYKSFEGGVILSHLVNAILPAGQLKDSLVASNMREIFLAVVVFLSFFCARVRDWTIPPPVLYLPAMVLFSSAMADQYLVIPLVACAIAWRNIFSWLYCTTSTWILLTSPHNIRAHLGPSFEMLLPSQIGGARYELAQFWLFFLLAFLYWSLISGRNSYQRQQIL